MPRKTRGFYPPDPRYLTLSFHISLCGNTFTLVIKSWFHSDDVMSYCLDKKPQLHSKLRFAILNPFLCCFITATGCLNAVQFMLSWIPASCVSISLLLSAHLPSSLTVQRLPNSEHHVAGIRCINGTHPPPHSLQKQQPAAASVLSDLLNLPHFNHDSAPLLSSRGSLARIPKPPAASSQRSSLSGVSRPVSQPARRGLELRKGRKEGGKKQRFQSMVRFLYTSHQMTTAEILFPETRRARRPAGLKGKRILIL